MGATASRTRVRKPQQQQEAEPVRAVLYVRISDDPEGTEKGVDRQEADCRAYAEAHNMTVVDVGDGRLRVRAELLRDGGPHSSTR